MNQLIIIIISQEAQIKMNTITNDDNTILGIQIYFKLEEKEKKKCFLDNESKTQILLLFC